MKMNEQLLLVEGRFDSVIIFETDDDGLDARRMRKIIKFFYTCLQICQFHISFISDFSSVPRAIIIPLLLIDDKINGTN